MTTPEGRVKRKVSEALLKYTNVYKFMPVQTGLGAVTLDYLVCANGKFVAIETKAPGNKPTERQQITMYNILRAEGTVLVIEDEAGIAGLHLLLKSLGCERA